MSPLPTIGHLIGGQLTQGGSRSAEVFNPATGKAEKKLLLADKLTVEQAIANAQAAYPEWRNTPPLKRARVMSKLKVLLE
ncbi:MAG: aldehyde dehydrogenase family protein, partial [Rhodoferax sp.]|nr:aldehyde dehydrogenase family protein [Rhodoferax sp.]